MSSKVQICNMAISHLAVSEEIVDFDTDDTEVAAACRVFFDVARKKLLRDFDWPFAAAVQSLVQLAVNPTVEWSYSYRYPANTISIRRVLNGATRVDTSSSRAQYSIGRDGTGRVLYSDLIGAEIQYTFDETDTERFTADFVIALSFYLAYLIVNRVTNGADTQKLKSDAHAGYRQAKLEAMANAASEEPRDEPPEADMISARG